MKSMTNLFAVLFAVIKTLLGFGDDIEVEEPREPTQTAIRELSLKELREQSGKHFVRRMLVAQ